MEGFEILFVIIAIMIIICGIVITLIKHKQFEEYQDFLLLKIEVLNNLGFSEDFLDNIDKVDDKVIVKSRRIYDDYSALKYFKDNKDKFEHLYTEFIDKQSYVELIEAFFLSNPFMNYPQYPKLESILREKLDRLIHYKIEVTYISSAGNNLGSKIISVNKSFLDRLHNDPKELMTKSEYSQLIKTKEKEMLSAKAKEYYDRINELLDLANNTQMLPISGSKEKIDEQINILFDKVIGVIPKIKDTDSEEWTIIDKCLLSVSHNISDVINENKMVSDYYISSEFIRLKETCSNLMKTQKEFNEYISQKVKSLSELLGIKISRNETVINDEFDYIRPYKKIINPFTAEVSATVFASAENSPLEYIVKQFYPDKEKYPDQIRNLHMFIEELETLNDARSIIDIYKKDFSQYITEVPDYIIKRDENGFYERLGFANVSEETLTIEYKFSYTSNGGMAQRAFTVPMNEDNVIKLIEILESKLTISSFAKEQRQLMTKKMRQRIKERDNYTCCNCGNSTYVEPNLLLEIDHIIPVAKGGVTEESNLQTLCWKCNRTKGSKI